LKDEVGVRLGKRLKDLSVVVAELQGRLKPHEPAIKLSRVQVLLLVAVVALVLALPFGIDRFWRIKPPLPASSESALGVETLVRQVQTEIAKSEENRKAKNIAAMFELKRFELEISFVARKTSSQSGNANFELVTVDNQLQVTAEQTHRLKLVMDVVAPEGTIEQSRSATPEGGQVLGRIPETGGAGKGVKR
jgi:Trypsin-co-occurring domain 2